MKKYLKKVMALTLAFSLTLGGIVCTREISAADGTNEWKEKAVIAPKEGSLVAAGYINVEFDNSLEGYTYTVYLDGKPMYWNGDDIVKTELGEKVTEDSVTRSFSSKDKGITEVYTTDVDKHEITVKAVKGSEEIVSEPCTFYVSKKGMALGGDMSDKVSLNKLNCSWYYNWATEAFNNSIDANVQHIPMMWGGADENKEAMTNFSTTANYILGFNEPDIGSQANMYFFDAIDVWKEYISPLNLRKVSPAPAAPGGNSGWLKQFMFGEYKCTSILDGSWGLFSEYENEETKTWVDGIADDVDAVVLHYYRNVINVEGLIDAVETLWTTYHKPIWITEISLFGVKNTNSDFSYEIPEKRKEMAAFVNTIVEKLDKIPYVERYCWFSYDIDSTNEIDGFNGSGATAMFEYATGLYTELGRLYSSIGVPSGYEKYVITDEEMYVTEDPTTEAPTTKQPVTTKKPTPTTNKVNPTTAKKKVPAQVKISKARNIKKRSIKLNWKKVSNAKKYQVQYSLNRKFTKSVKNKYTTKTEYKITKLKKKQYYIRIRAVNNAGKGKWSKIKQLKVRK